MGFHRIVAVVIAREAPPGNPKGIPRQTPGNNSQPRLESSTYRHGNLEYIEHFMLKHGSCAISHDETISADLSGLRTTLFEEPQHASFYSSRIILTYSKA